MTCATDLQERHKELLPESLYTEFVKQRRVIDKTYPSNSADYTKEMTALIRRFENIADHLNKTDTYHSMRETQAIERIQEGKEYMLKVNNGKPLTASQAINLGLQFTEGSTHPMPGGRDSADLAGIAFSKELGEIIYNWSSAHQLEKLNTGEDKLKIFTIKQKFAQDKTVMRLDDYANADPHTKAAAVVRVLELRMQQLYDSLGSKLNDDPNFIWHTTHDAVQINANQFDGWFKDIYPLLKKDTPMHDMYKNPTEGDVRNVLTGTYGLISENNFSEFDGHANLIFKDVESWLKYDEKYGSQGADWLHTVGQSIEKTSRRLAILQTFGPMPDAVFKTIKREIGLIHPEALKTKSKKLDLSYEAIRGRIYADTGTFYTVGSAVIQVHGIAQMAVSGFNAISGDVATIYTFSDTLLGNSVGEAMAHSVGGFSEIIKATVSPREAKRLAREAMIDVNDRYHLGSGSYIQDTPGYKASKMYGTLSKLQAINGYMNMLDPSTTGNKLSLNEIVSNRLIKDFKQGWDGLNRNQQIYYGTHFNDLDFDNLRSSLGGVDKLNIMSMNKIIENAQNLKLPDNYRIGETLKADAQKAIGDFEYNPREIFIRDRKKMYAADLKGKLIKLLIDSNNQGVTVGGLKEHRQLGGLDLFKGNQYLAVLGKATRQFKTTTTAALNNTIFQYRVASQAGTSRAMMLGVKFAYGTVVAGTVGALGMLVTKGTLPWEEDDFDAADYLIRSATTAGTFGIIGDELLTLLNPRTEVGHLLGSLNHQIYKLAQDVQPMNRASDDLRTVKMSKWLWQNFTPIPTIWGKDFKKGMVDYMNEYIKEVNRQKQRASRRRRK